jgi:hypothetical protein
LVGSNKREAVLKRVSQVGGRTCRFPAGGAGRFPTGGAGGTLRTFYEQPFNEWADFIFAFASPQFKEMFPYFQKICYLCAPE